MEKKAACRLCYVVFFPGKTLIKPAFSAIVAGIFALHCGGSSTVDINLTNPNFPSGADASGADAMSSSTNFSQKAFDPKQKADPLSGAAYIPVPQMNNYGGVSFSYKLDIPAGRAGVDPKIALSYSSSGGDGWTGVGWNIGMGAITRTTRYGQLFYDQNDVFTYGGKRLYKVSGPVNSQNGIYRLEIDDGTLARLELTDVESGGVWKVFEASGAITIYGENLAERVTQPADATKTYAWQFSKTVDRNGNYLSAIYDASEYAANRILYLKELRYTGNAAQGMAANQFVRFKLKDRSDAYVSRAAGFAMKMTKLLDEIEIGWDEPGGSSNKILWNYELEYITSEDSFRPLLKTIHSSRHATRPVFRYQAAAHTLGWQQLNNIFASDTQINPQLTQFVEGDFNGDGKSDFCFFNPENGDWKVIESSYTGGYAFKTYGNKFAGLKGQSQIQFFKGNVTGDYNGDGKSDVAMYLPEKKEFWIAESTGTNFNFKLYGKFVLTNFDIMKAEWFTGDYNGDGLSDVLLFDEESGDWIMMEAKGTLQSNSMTFGFTFRKIGNQFQHLYRDDYVAGIGNNSKATLDTSPLGKDRGKIQFFSGDYNGDGRSDIAFYDQRNGKWWVSNLTAQVTPNVGVTGYSISWLIYKVFTAPEQKLFAMDRFSGDYNGDGLSDFLLFDRANGDWWLGETTEYTTAQPATINFRKWSSMPQNKEITRWFQGDFNGDGQSDVAFYSATDNKIWVGEATPNGFRYKVYNDLNFGGPNVSVLAAAPLPIDEVQIKDALVYRANGTGTQKLQYIYDGNPNTGRGEDVFSGCYGGSCGGDPELLIYDKKNNKLSFKKGETLEQLNGISLNGTQKFLNLQDLNRTGLSYYQKVSLGLGYQHQFGRIYKNPAFTSQFFAKFDDNALTEFSFEDSLFVAGEFSAGDKKILALDDKAATASFKLLGEDPPIPFTIDQGVIPTTDLDFKKLLWQGTTENRLARKSIRIFVRPAEVARNPEVVIVDGRTSPHKWYRGIISRNPDKITFTKLNGTNIDLPSGQGEEYPDNNLIASWAGLADSAFYITRGNNQVFFHRIAFDLTGGNVQLIHYPGLASDVGFQWEFNAAGKPILRTGSGIKAFAPASGTTYALEDISDSDIAAVTVQRPDLYGRVYAFNWIQGDYNGDSKTDVGFFSLKEPKWYLALTNGTVPDLVERVDNGIGGSYQFTYANSTSFDNTDENGIPQLPMNYKVCTQLAVADGQGNTYFNQYIYKKGVAYSAYLPSAIGQGGGHKETDYFGFSEFTAIDGLGSRTISEFNRAPFGTVLATAIAQGQGADFYLKNRALSGAVKKSTFIGWDSKEYSRTTYDYEIKKIQILGAPSASYFPVQTQSSKYVQNILVQSSANTVNLNPGDFSVASRLSSATDHFSDAAHPTQTLTSRTDFERIADTNQERPTNSVTLVATPHQTTTAYTYDANGNVVQETHSYTGSGLALVAPRTMVYQYDGYGNRVSSTNVTASPSRRSELIYDDKLFQFVSEERLLGDSITLTQKVTHNFAAAFGSPDTVADANNNKKYITYDALGRITQVRADTDQGVQTLSTFVYTLTTADNDISPGSGFTAGALSAKTTQYTGPVTAGATPYDIRTRVFKDGVGRELQTLQSALETPGKRFVKSGRRVYDALGRITMQSQTDWAADDEFDALEMRALNTDKNPTRTDYDASGRVKKVTLPPAYAGEAETSVVTTYNDPWEVVTVHAIGQGKRTVSNARGQMIRVEDFGAAASGQPAISTQMGFCYDVAGNRIKRTDLNNNAMSCNDNAGENVSTWVFDAFGQLKTVNDPDTGTTNFTYTAFGELSTKTDARGLTTALSYDRLGRVTTKTLPIGEGTVTYGYDTAPNGLGKLATMDDAAQTKAFSYDRLGHRDRETRQLKVGNTSAIYETIYRYDYLDRTYEIDYPAAPFASAQGSPQRARVCYSYNSFASTAGVTALASTASQLASGAGCGTAKPIVSNIDYNEFGQMVKFDRGNGIASVYEYDTRGRVTKLSTDRNGTRYVDKVYTYNTQNSIEEINTTTTAAAQGANFTAFNNHIEYDYDGMNRLVAARGIATRYASSTESKKFELGYRYSLNGNLTQKIVSDYDTHATTDQWNYAYTNHKAGTIFTSATGINRFTMSYDAVGNTETKADTVLGLTKRMSYDSQNRIQSVENDATHEKMGEYRYDDQGFRVYKKHKQANPSTSSGPASTTTYELETPNKYFAVERQKDTANNPVPNTEYAVNNIFLDGVRIAAMVPTGQARWFMTDQVDSVNVVTNDAGDAISAIDYLPYGETWYQEGDTGFSPKYNSQELDKESGLYFFNARHYDPEIARFETADSVVDGESSIVGWNRYTYVHGNPIMYKDPTGHEVGDLKSSPVELRSDGTVGTGSAMSTSTSGNSFLGGGFDWSFKGIAQDLFSSALSGLAAGGKFLLSTPKRLLEWVIGDNYGQAWGEFFRGEWGKTKTNISKWGLPKSVMKGIDGVFDRVKKEVPDAAANGMHAWHAGSNADSIEKTGILGIIPVLLVGIFHETPIDGKSWKEEEDNQGTVNHYLDLTGDIVSNIFGIGLGVLLPSEISVTTGMHLGNYIPGPGDPQREVGGKHKPYTGHPTENWGPYFDKEEPKKTIK